MQGGKKSVAVLWMAAHFSLLILVDCQLITVACLPRRQKWTVGAAWICRFRDNDILKLLNHGRIIPLVIGSSTSLLFPAVMLIA